MSNSTPVLREQAGIQYQGVQDKSEADPRDSLLNVIVAGNFLRGRTDKPFIVTKANYRAKLGYDPNNKDFVAVEDALKAGASFVWVVRIMSKALFSCAGASDYFSFSRFSFSNNVFDVEVDGNLYGNPDGEQLFSFLDMLKQLDPSFPLEQQNDGFFDINNLTTREVRVRLIPNKQYNRYGDYTIDPEQSNSAYSVDNTTGVISFCLSAKRVISIPVPQPA